MNTQIVKAFGTQAATEDLVGQLTNPSSKGRLNAGL